MAGRGEMRLLLDTNILLEIVLDQENSSQAKSLLLEVEHHDFFLSDYSLHSIGHLLFHRKRHDAFRLFLQDMVVRAGLQILTLHPDDMGIVIDTAEKFSLDFDDAYQYAVASKYSLTLVSFDSDFDRTDRGRKIPNEISQ
jgi:predicted nucleic acid-binding protein